MASTTERGVTLIDVFARDGLQTVLHEPTLRLPSGDHTAAST